MMLVRTLNSFLVVLSLLYSSASMACGPIESEVFYDGTCTKVKTYKSSNLTNEPILLVVLHGDYFPRVDNSLYQFAKSIADRSTNLIAVGMIRPGFTDMEGRTSDGVEGESVGDNYGEPRVGQIAEAISKLKEHYNSSKVILLGHSGGAATAGNLIGLYKELVDSVFLVSCPCNINKWRQSMFKLRKKAVFEGDLEKTSPVDLVEHISDKIRIMVFVGNDDKVAPAGLSIEYVEALTRENKNVKFSMIEGGHEIFLNPKILDAVSDVVSDYNKALQPENG